MKTCCNGNCNQGRDCPHLGDQFVMVLAVVCFVVFVIVIALGEIK